MDKKKAAPVEKPVKVKKEKPAKVAGVAPLVKKKSITVASVLKIVCLLAIVIFVGSMFLGFWSFETYTEVMLIQKVLYHQNPEPIYKTVSIAEYVWLTEDNVDLFGDPEKDPEAMRRVKVPWTGPVDALGCQEGTYVFQNDIVGMPFVCTILILFAVIFFLLNKKCVWPSVLSLGAGGYALLALLQDKAGVYKPWEGKVIINEGSKMIPELVEKPFAAGINYNLVLIAAGILTVASLALFVVWVVRIIKWFVVKEVRY